MAASQALSTGNAIIKHQILSHSVPSVSHCHIASCTAEKYIDLLHSSRVSVTPWRQDMLQKNGNGGRLIRGRRRHGSVKQLGPLAVMAEDMVVATSPLASSGPDMFILEFADALQEQPRVKHEAARKVLDKLGEDSAEAGLSFRWPTSKDEEYRFTDLKPLRATELVPSGAFPGVTEYSHEGGLEIDMGKYLLDEANGSRIVFIDGVFSQSLSSLQEVPNEITVGTLGSLSDEVISKYVAPFVGTQCSRSTASLNLFSALNGLGAQDLGVVVVPEGVLVDDPIHILYLSSGSHKAEATKVTSPRVLVVVEKGGEVEIVEEFAGLGDGSYFTNTVIEVFLEEDAKLKHGYIQSQERESFHIKQTVVTQAARSEYALVEAGLGGRLSRHNLSMEQLGPDTKTEISTFLLAGDRQLQDLHSNVLLDHPRGQTRQVHKCIVTHATGHGVFDGKVRVNRGAQQTDAGQLSRNLLLAPRGTLNVKPNLQIVADDVKCTHGATISDLEDDQLFYFRSRGIDEHTARSALVYSFAAEVIGKLPYPGLRKRIELGVKNALLKEGAMDSLAVAGLSGGSLQ